MQAVRLSQSSLLLFALGVLVGCAGPGGGTGGSGSDGFTWGTDTTFGGDAGGSGDATARTDAPPTNVGCTSDQQCPVDVPYCGDDGLCKECLSTNDCKEGTCESGFCLSEDCTPDATMCQGPSMQLICNASGTGWIQAPCSSGFCTAGKCTLCEPSATVCQGFKVVACSEDGQSSTEIDDCGAKGQLCADGACRNCAPGQPQCNGDVREVCNGEGQWVVDQDCAEIGSTCLLGVCLDPCDLEVKDSNAGCDYWAVNLDNINEAITAPNYQ